MKTSSVQRNYFEEEYKSNESRFLLER